ncbi:hypothetical protein MMC08_004829 [Hypocenomyce scalaris]|nr:hypothetical protein [Hypocenomyce scalaris]
MLVITEEGFRTLINYSNDYQKAKLTHLILPLHSALRPSIANSPRHHDGPHDSDSPPPLSPDGQQPQQRSLHCHPSLFSTKVPTIERSAIGGTATTATAAISGWLFLDGDRVVGQTTMNGQWHRDIAKLAQEHENYWIPWD